MTQDYTLSWGYDPVQATIFLLLGALLVGWVVGYIMGVFDKGKSNVPCPWCGGRTEIIKADKGTKVVRRIRRCGRGHEFVSYEYADNTRPDTTP